MQSKLINTFSIVAFDAHSGELGSASASRSLAVGGAIIYSRPGAGIVNTQHHANLRLGETALRQINSGKYPQAALDAVLEDDPMAQARQFIAIDKDNRKGAWTGADCIDIKHHQFGDSCVAAGNHLAGKKVIDQMVKAFEKTGNQSLSWRLLMALEAGEAAGGDKRGKQSAAIKVVPPSLARAGEVNVDLRVDDHPQPLVELRRLCTLFWQDHS